MGVVEAPLCNQEPGGSAMTEPSSADAPGQVYDRSFLLSPDKRNQLMELWEVERYGQDCFSDPNYVSIYGVSPPEWYARGIRLLARTTLECVRDPFGDLNHVQFESGSSRWVGSAARILI